MGITSPHAVISSSVPGAVEGLPLGQLAEVFDASMVSTEQLTYSGSVHQVAKLHGSKAPVPIRSFK